jgi:3-phosphoshikimate 1-carboxyvinyltransferase
VPGDKSISHRTLILATLAAGRSTVQGILRSDDVRATTEAMRQLGASIHEEGGETRIAGQVQWRAPEEEIDCGNRAAPRHGCFSACWPASASAP